MCGLSCLPDLSVPQSQCCCLLALRPCCAMTPFTYIMRALLPIAIFSLPAPGPYAVQTKTYSIPELKTTGGTKTAEVYAPKTPGIYPYISFAHGIIDAGYDALMRDIAAYGFVVSNMKTCAGEPVCSLATFTEDQLYMLDFAEAMRKQGDLLFSMANTTNVGLAGHSYGGMATATNTRKNDPRVRAAWHLNPCPCSAIVEGGGDKNACKAAAIGVPVVYSTSSGDNVCDQVQVYDHFHCAKAKTKFFANADKFVHQDPEYPAPQGGHWNGFVGKFFRCYLSGESAACGYMDSQTQSDTLCKAYPMLVGTYGKTQCFTPSNPDPYHAGDPYVSSC